LYRRCSDGVEFVTELISQLEAGEANGGEAGFEKVLERQLNLKHRFIAAPIGCVLSRWGDVAEVRAVPPYMEGGLLTEVLAGHPLWWTATAKAIAVAGLTLGLRFANRVGQPHGPLRAHCVLFDRAGAIQIAGIGAARSVGGGDAEFAAPEIQIGGPRVHKQTFFHSSGF
jgi:hypothetical protein